MTRQFGPWKVIGELGRGGMGRVLLVEREGPRQQAALKILPPFSFGEAERRRFRREQELLARLEHPNIARFLDAGETPQGEPYLVLERVEGLPLDLYCATTALTLRQRLEIFLDLCKAVAAAHHQLIVHCDLTPSNVLVRADGTVKLTDFGLARLTDQQPAIASLSGGFSTLAYASPEQLEGRPVSAASDVYSLGVLLFEILTGRRLFGGEQALLGQAARRRDPPRASASLPAESRPALRRALLRDLDYVIAKAVRPAPADRYASVDELIGDLEAFLEGRPVDARRGDRRYSATHFLRRHAISLLAGVLVLGTALAATVTLGLQARRLGIERDQAQREATVASRSAEFFLALLGPPPTEGQRKDLTIHALAGRAMVELDHSLQDARLVRAQVLAMLGNHHRLRGNGAEGERLFRQALQLWKEDLGDRHPLIVRGLEAVALSRLAAGDIDQGCVLAEQAFTLATELGEPKILLGGINARGVCALQTERYQEADRLLSEAERLSAVHFGRASVEHESQLENLTFVKKALHRDREFETLLRQILNERRERRPGRSDPFTLRRGQLLATLLVARGALDEAEVQLKGLLDGIEAMAGQPYQFVSSLHPGEAELQLAEILRRRGRPREALEQVRRAAAHLRRDVPPDSGRHREARRVEALILLDVRSFVGAAKLLEQVRAEILDADPGNPQLAELEAALAKARAGVRAAGGR